MSLGTLIRSFLGIEPDDQPTKKQIYDAENNAACFTLELRKCQRYMRRLFSSHTDAEHAARLIAEVLQAVLEDHDGDPPYKVFHDWCKQRHHLHDKDIFATPEDKEAMVKIWERWNDKNRVLESIQVVVLANEDFTSCHPVSEERILQIKQCLQDWLQKRKVGLAYWPPAPSPI